MATDTHLASVTRIGDFDSKEIRERCAIRNVDFDDKNWANKSVRADKSAMWTEVEIFVSARDPEAAGVPSINTTLFVTLLSRLAADAAAVDSWYEHHTGVGLHESGKRDDKKVPLRVVELLGDKLGDGAYDPWTDRLAVLTATVIVPTPIADAVFGGESPRADELALYVEYNVTTRPRVRGSRENYEVRSVSGKTAQEPPTVVSLEDAAPAWFKKNKRNKKLHHRPFLVDDAGVWIGLSSGLMRLDGDVESGPKLTKKDGLPSPDIIGLHQFAGAIMVSTPKGFAQVEDSAVAQSWIDALPKGLRVSKVVGGDDGSIWFYGSSNSASYLAGRFFPGEGPKTVELPTIFGFLSNFPILPNGWAVYRTNLFVSPDLEVHQLDVPAEPIKRAVLEENVLWLECVGDRVMRLASGEVPTVFMNQGKGGVPFDPVALALLMSDSAVSDPVVGRDHLRSIEFPW